LEEIVGGLEGGSAVAFASGMATLLRLSVGIEAVEDLWSDLDRALRSTAAGS
jgi:cystathionine beta-lyase/cystathionine gamma-synthase